MEVNKYLQHIIRKNSNKHNLQDCLHQIDMKKQEDIRTYLFLIEKRLQLDNSELAKFSVTI
jgi:hypothetical protein